MITLARAVKGGGVFGLANRKLPVGRRALKMLSPLLLPLVPKLKIKGMGEVDGIESSLARARGRFPHGAQVLVVPHGGSTYPILPA
jgi:hypothetical protein